MAPDTVVLDDEVTQVSTRDPRENFAAWASRTGTVLVFLGDRAQLSSIGAGGWSLMSGESPSTDVPGRARLPHL